MSYVAIVDNTGLQADLDEHVIRHISQEMTRIVMRLISRLYFYPWHEHIGARLSSFPLSNFSITFHETNTFPVSFD